MAVALWTLHCYVFDRFTITPRLVLLSPVRGCGKTTLLALLELLVANPDKSDNTTPAAIYHSFTRSVPTLLIDEADNLGLATSNVLRAVFNAGHRRGGAIKRFIRGWPRKFPVFAPLALAGMARCRCRCFTAQLQFICIAAPQTNLRSDNSMIVIWSSRLHAS
jgi:hypothetical protein